jgi:hypothetical protein
MCYHEKRQQRFSWNFNVLHSFLGGSITAIETSSLIKNNNSIQLLISIIPTEKESSLSDLKFYFTLTNKGKEKQILFLPLNLKSEKSACLFWGISSDNGLFSSLGGKISFSSNEVFRYVTLEQEDSFSTVFTLSDLIPNFDWAAVPNGVYTLTGVYKNQYGEKCFKGQIESTNTIKITVKDGSLSKK